MRITTYYPNQYLNFGAKESHSERFDLQNKHDNEVDSLFINNRFRLGNYKTKDGSFLSVNQEVRALFSRITRHEIDAQSFSDEAITEGLRQIYKEKNYIMSKTLTMEIDLDDDVSMEAYKDYIKDMTLALADGDKEALEELEAAYKAAMKELKDQLGIKYSRDIYELEKGIDQRFEDMMSQEELETVDFKLDKSQLELPELKQLYFDTMAEPFRIKEPEIIIEMTFYHEIEGFREPSYISVEKTTERLEKMSREILDEGLATVAELRSAFANGYNESVPHKFGYNLQSATYKEMMQIFDGLEEEYPS